MPGCFSRFSNKFSKGRKDIRKNSQSGLPPDSKPNDVVNPAVPEHRNPDGVASTKQSPEQKIPKDRWREAFNDLSEDKQEALRKLGFSDKKPGPMGSGIKDLAGTVKEKQKACEDKFLKAKICGKEIVFREYTTEIVGWLEKAGDIAIQFAPPQASLPWDLVKNLMKIPVNESEQMGALLLTTQVVVSITSRCQIYEHTYLNQVDEGALGTIQSQLEKSLIELYKTSLDLLAKSGSLLSSGTPRRIVEAIVNPGKAKDSLANLGQQEDNLLKDVQACEVDRSATADKRSNEMLEMLQAPMTRVDEGVGKLLSHVNEKERIELLQWISSIPFGEHHDDFRERRTAGTGDWLIEHEDFQSWKEADLSVLFWLQGDPGSGKSYLTSKVIDTMRDRISYPLKNEGFAFFYCKHDDKPRDNPLAVLQSFVRQLSTTVKNPESIQTELKEICQDAQIKGTNFRLKQCKEQILASLDIYEKSTLVIDAMDECDPELRYELVKAVQLFLTESKKPLRIFITSRPDTALENQLKTSPNVGIQASDNQRDIEKFINVELDRQITATPFLKNLKPVIVAKLLERCHGMFQWVSLQLTRIGQSNRPAKVHKCLDTLPDNLKEAYDQVWREIETEDESDQTLIKRAFLWVLSACKPMSSDELLWAIRFNPTEDPLSLDDEIDEQGLLSLCRNLLVIDSQLKVWRFAHLSVREYIEKEKDWTLPDAHLHAASVCLLVLNNTYDKVDPLAVLNPSDLPMKPEIFDPSHPFQMYVRHHWVFHVQGTCNAEKTILASQLKAFLGSPEVSSLQYQRWYDQISIKDVDKPPTSVFGYQSTSVWDIRPANVALFAMCRFSFDTILHDWWENTDFQHTYVNFRGLNLLATAALGGCTPICKRLVEKGLDANLQFEYSPINPFGSILSIAAYGGHIELVKYLVQAGAHVNEHHRSGDYGNAIAMAAWWGHPEVIRYLVQAGTNVNIVFDVGNFGSALAAAAAEGSLENVKFLIQEGNAEVNLVLHTGRFGSALAAAVSGFKRGVKLETVKYLVKEGHADVNLLLQCGDYGSALAAAAYGGKLETVKYLVKEGHADVNLLLQCGDYGSALAAAAYGGKLETVKYLVKEGHADVNLLLQCGDYGSALAAAAASGEIETIKCLMGANVDVNQNLVVGKYGSALDAASNFGRKDCVELLIDAGAEDPHAEKVAHS